MKSNGEALAAGFTAALAIYLRDHDEAALSQAYDLGRNAVNRGLGVLEVALMYQDAINALLRDAGEQPELNRAAEFLFEALAPFEMAFRGYKDANEQLRGLTERLDAANKELEAFSYSVSHDLRAPVRHIAGFSELLLEAHRQSLPPDAVRYVTAIQQSAKNMARMIEDLLNLSRIERQPLVRHTIDLNSVVANVVRELERDTAGRTIDWRLEPLPTIAGDPGLIKIVFTNLLSNAVKYTRRKEVAVITVGQVDDQSATVVFVRDNGAGFDPAYADRLFTVFQRLHRADEFEGTGVGLATVERIVRRHGGTIRAEAIVDVGATFYIRFP